MFSRRLLQSRRFDAYSASRHAKEWGLLAAVIVHRLSVCLGCALMVCCHLYGQNSNQRRDATVISRHDIGHYSFRVQSISRGGADVENPHNNMNGPVYWVDALDNDTGETRRVWQRQFASIFPDGCKPRSFLIAQRSASKFALAYCEGLFSVRVEEFTVQQESDPSLGRRDEENGIVKKSLASNCRDRFFATHVLSEKLGLGNAKFGIFPPVISNFRFVDNSWEVTLSTSLSARTPDDESEMTRYRFRRDVDEAQWKFVAPVITERKPNQLDRRHRP